MHVEIFCFMSRFSALDSLSLSTCWCSGRHTDGYEMVEQMVGLGFKKIELSHGIRLSLVPGILRAVEEGIVEIPSIHNFCPLPSSVHHAAPNFYQPASSNSSERDLWLHYSMQTLNFAQKVGAEHIVMHSGNVNFVFTSAEFKLEKWIDNSGISFQKLIESEDFRKQRERAMKRIQRVSEKAMLRLKENYERLLPNAREMNLTLCLENREGLEEMPIDSEHEMFLDSLNEPINVGYWHDTGHAQIKHHLGLLDHRAHLEKMAPRLFGFHLHDVSECGLDHQVPGTGTVDFNMVSEFICPEHTLVLELSPKLTVDEVLMSRDYIVQKID